MIVSFAFLAFADKPLDGWDFHKRHVKLSHSNQGRSSH
jgi:hypothetical protein